MRACVFLLFAAATQHVSALQKVVRPIVQPSSLSMSAEERLPVAVTGSTGKLGRAVVQCLSSAGIRTRCLVRHALPADASSQEEPTPSTEPLPADASIAEVMAFLAGLPGVTLIKGDVTDSASMVKLLQGTSACLAVHGARRSTKLRDFLPWVDETAEASHSKQVNYEGVRNIIKAATASGTCKRIVRITGKGEEPWSVFSILINLLGSMAKAWNREGETLLRECGAVDYTIVRPGVMGTAEVLPEGSTLGLADNGDDLKVTPIPHGAIAELCVRCLDYPNAARSTLCAMAVPVPEGGAVEPGESFRPGKSFEPGESFGQAYAPRGQPGESFGQIYAPLLAKVTPDSRAFAPSYLAQHLRAVRIVGAGLLAVGALIASSLLQLVLVAVRSLLG